MIVDGNSSSSSSSDNEDEELAAAEAAEEAAIEAAIDTAAGEAVSEDNEELPDIDEDMLARGAASEPTEDSTGMLNYLPGVVNVSEMRFFLKKRFNIEKIDSISFHLIILFHEPKSYFLLTVNGKSLVLGKHTYSYILCILISTLCLLEPYFRARNYT